MAKEIMLEDGRTALFDDTATEDEINQKLKSQNLKRQSGPAQPKEYASVPQLGPVVPAAASFVNSLAFGLPEMAARSLGGGEYIDAVRKEYPVATTAGDVAGLANPYRLAAKAGQAGAARLLSTPQATAEALARPMGTGPGITQTARNVAQRTAGIGTGIIGAQTGAAALGGARSENYGAGAQQGAQVFRDVATNLPGTQLIPGAQTTMNAVTNVVPSVLGAGAAAANYMSIDEMIRQEAAKRALQGPR
jgi:hypothetical protein